MRPTTSLRRLGFVAAFSFSALAAGAAVAGPCDGAKHRRVIVKFEVGSSTVSAEDKARLKDWVPGATNRERVCLLGQADKQGSEQANKGLSKRRAEAVRRVLIGYGLPSNIIETQIQEKQFTLFGLLDEDQENDRRVVVGHSED